MPTAPEPTSAEIIQLIERALMEDVGIVITTTNRRHLSAQLYDMTQTREEWKCLAVTHRPNSEEIILHKKYAQVELD